jgi:hypothetical protein
MAKVVKTGIDRDKNRMYFIKGNAVWSAPMKRKGMKAKGKRVKEATFSADLDYSKNMYYVDGAGDVASTPRARGRKKAKKK